MSFRGRRRRISADALIIHTAIEDNGCGFDPEHTVPGFGMLTMQDYCGAAGGKIEIDSSVGQGTTITSVFPVSVGEVAAPSDEEESLEYAEPVGAHAPPPGAATPPQREGVTTVMIVDDQPEFCSLVEEMLKPFPDFQVIGVSQDGRSGLELVEKWSPDLVVLDVEMPGLTGPETSRLIRARGYSSKVVLVSARDRSSYEDGLLDCGASDFINKAEFSVARLRQAYHQTRVVL